MHENTRDFSNFGSIEIDEAGRLLQAYAANKNILGDGVEVEFNPMSGNVFLVDDNFDVAMLNDAGVLERFYFCFICGYEVFESEFNNYGEEWADEHSALNDDDSLRCPDCKEVL